MFVLPKDSTVMKSGSKGFQCTQSILVRTCRKVVHLLQR